MTEHRIDNQLRDKSATKPSLSVDNASNHAATAAATAPTSTYCTAMRHRPLKLVHGKQQQKRQQRGQPRAAAHSYNSKQYQQTESRSKWCEHRGLLPETLGTRRRATHGRHPRQRYRRPRPPTPLLLRLRSLPLHLLFPSTNMPLITLQRISSCSLARMGSKPAILTTWYHCSGPRQIHAARSSLPMQLVASLP